MRSIGGVRSTGFIGRLAVCAAACLATGCGPALVFNDSQAMTPDQTLARADHAFTGVIESQNIQSWPSFFVPREEHPGNWTVLRRRVRVENVLPGSEPRPDVDIYEVVWAAGTTGDWNGTDEGSRYLFLVRTENGRYHIVRDWWRSVFPVNSGRHPRLPLDDSHPFWERVALLQWWIKPDWSERLDGEDHKDPNGMLNPWRMVKIARGLIRHPDPRIRRIGCHALVPENAFEDECRFDLHAPPETGEAPDVWSRHRALHEFNDLASQDQLEPYEIDRIRLFTTVSNRALRERFCREFTRRFPADHDNGCPADQPPPATIVTENGDVPLIGAWPAQK